MTKQNLTNGFALTLLTFALCGTGAAHADFRSSAYGPQAQMSPATTNSTLSIGNNGGANNSGNGGYIPGNGGYIPGNGVYLTGQPAIVSQPNPQAALPPVNNFPITAAPPGMPMQNGAPYYAPQAPVYGSPYGMNYGAPYQGGQPMGAQVPGQMGYSAPNYSGADPAGTYVTNKPAYGMPPHMVQRNSANYYNESLPYRNNPGVTLNPNSYISHPQADNKPKYNEQALNILNYNQQQQQNQNAQNNQGVQSQPTNNNTPKKASNRIGNTTNNWMNKVFQRSGKK